MAYSLQERLLPASTSERQSQTACMQAKRIVDELFIQASRVASATPNTTRLAVALVLLLEEISKNTFAAQIGPNFAAEHSCAAPGENYVDSVRMIAYLAGFLGGSVAETSMGDYVPKIQGAIRTIGKNFLDVSAAYKVLTDIMFAVGAANFSLYLVPAIIVALVVAILSSPRFKEVLMFIMGSVPLQKYNDMQAKITAATSEFAKKAVFILKTLTTSGKTASIIYTLLLELINVFYNSQQSQMKDNFSVAQQHVLLGVVLGIFGTGAVVVAGLDMAGYVDPTTVYSALVSMRDRIGYMLAIFVPLMGLNTCTNPSILTPSGFNAWTNWFRVGLFSIASVAAGVFKSSIQNLYEKVSAIYGATQTSSSVSISSLTPVEAIPMTPLDVVIADATRSALQEADKLMAANPGAHPIQALAKYAESRV